jgi:hypothetical protein
VACGGQFRQYYIPNNGIIWSGADLRGVLRLSTNWWKGIGIFIW